MAGHIDNEIVIDAPMDVVWRMTNELESWPEIFTEYAAIEVLGERDGAITFRLTTRPDPAGRVWSWVSERTPDEATRTVRSRRVENGVFKYMNLFWEYREAPAGTRLRWVQDFELKADAHTDDAGMTEHLGRSTRVQQQHIKECIERAVARTA